MAKRFPSSRQQKEVDIQLPNSREVEREEKTGDINQYFGSSRQKHI
jgi:hypothetical protein